MVLGLFNLLLAVLLEALGSAQNEQREAPSVVSEMCEIVTDLACRTRGAVFPSGRTKFMSDAQLQAELLGRRFRTLHEQDLRAVVIHTSQSFTVHTVDHN